jgi:hypothetical protein
MVRELPKSGAIVSHDVVEPLEVRQVWKIALEEDSASGIGEVPAGVEGMQACWWWW